MPAPPPRSDRAIRAAVVVGGSGLALLVAHDGTPGWRVARAVLVGLATAVLVRALSAWDRRRAGLAWVIGAGLTATGVGIALPHLTKTGLTPTAVAGVLVLGAGLVLLAAAGAGLLRSRRWWERPVLGVALLATLGLVVLTLGQAVAATNVPRTAVGQRDPGDLGLAHRDVTFDASDGVRLSAWYVPSRNGAAVVLLHGAGSTRSAVLDHAGVLAAHGYGLLLPDARGHGRSEGRAMDFGWYGDEDVIGAVSFLADQPDVRDGRIGVLGLSMGGEEAIGAAAADPRILAVVAEGATNRTAHDKAWLSDEHGWRGAVQEGIERATYGLTDLLTAASPPISLRDAVGRTSPRPVLLIAGGSVPDEPLAGRYIASGAPDAVELWVVPGAGHTAGLRTQPHAWEARVTSFLAAALRPVPPRG